MPPVTKTDQSTLRKDVEFVAKDDAEQIATGIVMVPWAVDLQGDWERPETIAQFADQFANFEEVGEAGGGVMHAVWPDDHVSLERNEVLEEASDIGGETAPAGAWIQSWQFENDDLWELVADGILEGYSIGAVDVRWDGPMEQEELPEEVSVPSELGEDTLVWELTDGIVREVSAVDIPAVPDAQILETKADADKRLADHLGSRDGFIEEAMERGHTEAEAEQLWEYLNDAVDIEGAGGPGKQSFFARIGKAAYSALTGSDDGADETSSPEAPDRSTKEGRTLSKANRDSVMAQIDAGLDVLADAGVDDLPKRFTDREDIDFDLSEHDAREMGDGGDGESDEDEADDKHATGGDTPDDSTTMSDDTPDDPWEDAPEWAKDLRDTQEEHSKQIDELAGDGGDADKNAGSDGGDDPWDEAPEWAKSLKEQQEQNAERIDTISQQSGYSDQLGKSGGDGEDDESGLDALGKALSN